MEYFVLINMILKKNDSITNIINNIFLILFFLIFIYYFVIKIELIVRLSGVILCVLLYIFVIYVCVWYFIIRHLKFYKSMIN